MTKTMWTVLILSLLALATIPLADAQTTMCMELLNLTPVNCPNAGCHEQFPSLLLDRCGIGGFGPCQYFVKISWCCGAYQNWSSPSNCLMTEMNDRSLRQRIFTLAKEEEILVPTCHGAYIPAMIAFKADLEGGNEM